MKGRGAARANGTSRVYGTTFALTGVLPGAGCATLRDEGGRCWAAFHRVTKNAEFGGRARHKLPMSVTLPPHQKRGNNRPDGPNDTAERTSGTGVE